MDKIIIILPHDRIRQMDKIIIILPHDRIRQMEEEVVIHLQEVHLLVLEQGLQMVEEDNF
jgi:hypothetical protein